MTKSNGNTTEMVKGPAQGEASATTPATEPTPNVKLVKIRTKQQLVVGGVEHTPGSIVEVPEEVAVELTKPIAGQYDFIGENHSSNPTRHQHIRAERV